MAISPDGKMLLTGCGDMTDGLACLWTLPPGDGASPQRLLREGAVWAVAFSPDGQMVIAGCQDGTVRLWDKATGTPVGPAWQHEGTVWSVVTRSGLRSGRR